MFKNNIRKDKIKDNFDVCVGTWKPNIEALCPNFFGFKKLILFFKNTEIKLKFQKIFWIKTAWSIYQALINNDGQKESKKL